ncbi:TPA: IS1 family transposase, partial [Escherichia coli]|nr:IS1 family transposase [Escherichia coli]
APRSHIKRLDRKTICFSCSVETHEKIIGSFIEKHMFR